MLTILILENIILITLGYFWVSIYGTNLVHIRSFFKLIGEVLGGALGGVLEISVEMLESSIIKVREVVKSSVYIVVRRFKR